MDPNPVATGRPFGWGSTREGGAAAPPTEASRTLTHFDALRHCPTIRNMDSGGNEPLSRRRGQRLHDSKSPETASVGDLDDASEANDFATSNAHLADERSACGVGFVVSRRCESRHDFLRTAIGALSCVEHRGAVGADGVTSDGAGIMAEIPFELLGHARGTVAVATVFVSRDPDKRRRALRIFREVFAFAGFEIIDRRPVPIQTDVLGAEAARSRPDIVHIIFAKPAAIRTESAFNAQLHFAQQRTRSRLRAAGAALDLHMASLSPSTIVYKALTRSEDLAPFYPDLTDPRFVTRFALFHRRFSTNTRTSWDRAQPFRLIAHNGEINTIAGNRSWSYSREQALGLPRDELLTHGHTSDSGSLNQAVEALKYRSSMPHTEDILAIMVPPAGPQTGYYRFWGRAMEPWDGPAFLTYADGDAVGARLDRNGFRPCRWAMTDDAFFLASEAGIFGVDETAVVAKGTLNAGHGVRVNLDDGEIHFRDPSRSRENRGASFEPRLAKLPIDNSDVVEPDAPSIAQLRLYGVTRDEVDRVLVPMIHHGKEPIGSMGDTAQPAVLSSVRRGVYEFFFQDFAQVTNPPLDFLRERMVTDLSTALGKRPNIFAPKELLPPVPAWSLDSPLVSSAAMAAIHSLSDLKIGDMRVHQALIDATFDAAAGPEGLDHALRRIADDALTAVRSRRAVLILSDRRACAERPPVPSLLALRSVVNALNKWGLRLEASVVVEAGDIRTPHHLACAIGFGATAVCPWLALAWARSTTQRELRGLDAAAREANLLRALEKGLLKVMSKVGISVLRSYQSSKLYTPLGLGRDVVDAFFPGVSSPVGGLSLLDLGADLLATARASGGENKLPRIHRFKEPGRRATGERHAMTAPRSKTVHELVADGVSAAKSDELWRRYLDQAGDGPARLSHLLDVRPSRSGVPLSAVEPASMILRRFGSGAMSFGALSAQAQRDIFMAMRAVGGRSNSGEGGENPYYFVDGTCASTKQIASGRFGVTAEYLVTGDEIEIKMAQGAKPGEGGQLMGVKVSSTIARARHATPGVDLISPPPQHDIYSIEDLKQLIYELKQLSPSARICVKLVAGKGVGTVAAGVVKAGADVIQVSGGSGGTGAATLTSMMHAGLPWEVGLVDVHQTLIQQGLRHHVTLRVDGGLHTGADIVVAAALGAEEFGFGKLVLVAQGCIIARICEKNRCPRGIATHEPRFLEKYRGKPEHIVRLLHLIAEDVRRQMARAGVTRFEDLVGRTGLLRAHPNHAEIAAQRGLDLDYFLDGTHFVARAKHRPDRVPVGRLGARVTSDCKPAIERGEKVRRDYRIASIDRAVLTQLSGELARQSHQRRMDSLRSGTSPDHDSHTLPAETVSLTFTGSAGQGFGAFLVGGVDVRLEGEANDNVCKSMSGGRVVIVPHRAATFAAEENAIVGNGTLYGATGGELFVRGQAGDRFAVRNSGAIAVVEGAGLHACEYMTQGKVVILGDVSFNVGAGMTGGEVYLFREATARINDEYLRSVALSDADAEDIGELLKRHLAATGSAVAQRLLADWSLGRTRLRKCVPIAALQHEARGAVA